MKICRYPKTPAPRHASSFFTLIGIGCWDSANNTSRYHTCFPDHNTPTVLQLVPGPCIFCGLISILVPLDAFLDLQNTQSLALYHLYHETFFTEGGWVKETRVSGHHPMTNSVAVDVTLQKCSGCLLLTVPHEWDPAAEERLKHALARPKPVWKDPSACTGCYGNVEEGRWALPYYLSVTHSLSPGAIWFFTGILDC